MKLPEYKHFFAVHGKKAETLGDMRTMLEEMSDKDFSHHVTNEKNDFANWLRDILHRDFLAEKIAKIKTRKEALELVNDELLKDSEYFLGTSEEFKRFLVKEFIYGMLLGIIIGIIITQLI